ncbi:hypothetical protein Pmar_PMAR019922 [Perkinsus marinus ATCC 50983]|uniref:Uncharacterized protein n=1 Tax=Perkinsus marinus (strain ATCC 50983 / TXsc) TaxID=423536 RepID=C5KC08_PERM5|nr:hypothetical protein Pmar_PMAR019922 [Perkinsus marinus ATCC 50983]EER18039.1 hypothetical protein Pmar_PMAR019922 [Perkinsus marinus ATCC 50983]|eukprot:XP_002786243.1 hypothetical protein Pmar_PMAR019922 [Perkinsus marinus ATCC 50983]
MRRHTANLDDLEALQDEFEEAKADSAQWPCDVKLIHEAKIFEDRIAGSITLRKAELEGTYQEPPDQLALAAIADGLDEAIEVGVQAGVATRELETAR